MARAAKRSVYYAHAMCTYGHPDEGLALDFIRRSFPGYRVVNPAGYDNHPEKARDSVAFCLRLVEKCEGLVFQRLLGKVTAGVGKEVNHALAIGKPVYELKNEQLVRRSRKVAYVSVRATIALYGRWRRRRPAV